MSTTQHRTAPTPAQRSGVGPAALAAAAAWMLAALPASAATLALQASQSDQLRPPTPSDRTSGPGLLALVLFVLLFALVVVAMLIPTKRGHQD